LAVGLERLGGLLSKVIGAETQDHLTTVAQAIDLLLRVLHNAFPNTTKRAIQAGSLMHTTHHALIDLLAVALQSAERLLSDDATSPCLPGSAQPIQPEVMLHVLVKMLRFVLGLGGEAIGGSVKPDYVRLAVSYLRVLSVGSCVTYQVNADEQ
jgi:hypothetical protein